MAITHPKRTTYRKVLIIYGQIPTYLPTQVPKIMMTMMLWNFLAMPINQSLLGHTQQYLRLITQQYLPTVNIKRRSNKVPKKNMNDIRNYLLTYLSNKKHIRVIPRQVGNFSSITLSTIHFLHITCYLGRYLTYIICYVDLCQAY